MADEQCIDACAPNVAQDLPTNAAPVMAGGGGGVGPQGPQGPAGAQGPQGATGPQGAVGPAGPQGPAGPVGPAGADGLNGADGAQGPQGATGGGLVPDEYGDLTDAKIAAIEAAGIEWVYVVNPEGDLRADQNVPPSLAGDMERHIIQFQPVMPTPTWQDFGFFTGVEGPVGPTGPAGATGATGPQGPAGPAGADGAQGPQGIAGPQGPDGPAGPQGPDGPQGPQGPQGLIGNTGATGPTGPEGPQGDPAPPLEITDTATINLGGTGEAGTPLTADVKLSAVTGNQLTADAAGLLVVPEVTIVVDATTAKTIALADTNKYIRMTNASAKTLTVPPNATLAFPQGTTIAFINANTGNLTITPGAGVTINKPSTQTFVLAAFSSAILTKVGTDIWDLAGNMEPV